MIRSFFCPGCGDFIKDLGEAGRHAKTRTGCDQEKRFWGRIKKTDGCWLWQGAVNTTGYGMTTWDKAKNTVAHRLAWKLLRGPIPAGLRALHKCDTPRCCNPDHIFLGTQAENMADCRAKGRFASLSSPQMDEQRVREIRRLRAAGVKTIDLSKRFGISPSCISAIVTRRTWGQVE